MLALYEVRWEYITGDWSAGCDYYGIICEKDVVQENIDLVIGSWDPRDVERLAWDWSSGVCEIVVCENYHCPEDSGKVRP